LKIIAATTDAPVIERISNHLGLAARTVAGGLISA